jgi:hypothetical protein
VAKTIVIPASIEEATEKLNGIEELLTAKGWERAAIVYAFTYDAQGRRNLDEKSSKLSITDFAALKIHGLRTRDSIRQYREAWQEAEGDEPVPGQRVRLPDIPFPATRSGTDGYNTPEGAANTINKIAERHGSAPFKSAVTGNRRTSRAAQEAVDEKHRRDFQELVRKNQSKDSDDLQSAANTLMPSEFDSVRADIYRSTLIARAISKVMTSLTSRERKEVSKRLYEHADMWRMVAEAYATNDIDSELQDILNSVEEEED